MYCVDLVLSPGSGTELGGTKLFIAGPCFTSENGTVCRFNNDHVTPAVYVSPEVVYCITPPLYRAGLIRVELSLDDGATFNFTGIFRSSEFENHLIIYNYYVRYSFSAI